MPTKKDVVDRLLWLAFGDEHLRATPNSYSIKKARKEGKDLPERCKPGRLLEKLTEEEREIAKTLTEADFDHRLNPFMY